MGGRSSLLLVHGAWHGPWCFDETVAALAAQGVVAETVALPSCGADPAALGGLAEDAAAIAAAAAAMPGDVVVVAHSYGGMAVTDADFGGNVRGLVYLAAFMPVEGATLLSHFPPGPPPPFVAMRGDGTVGVVRTLARDAFYNDLGAAEAARAIDRLVLHSVAAITTPVARCAWRTIPSTYVVCTEDRIIPPAAQRAMAANAGAVAELVSGHCPMLSRPAALADLLAATTAGQRPRERAGVGGRPHPG